MQRRDIQEIEAEIIDEFAFLDDWMDKYQHIIDLGKALPSLDTSYKTDDNIVRGCQSQVWLVPEMKEDQLYFHADSDAFITKGLIALLVRVLSGHTPDEVLETDMAFVDKIGIRDHLSPTRSNGLNAMLKKMKMYALAYKVKNAGAN